MIQKLIHISFFFLCITLHAQQSLRTVENEAFGLGEKLEYKVGYQSIKAGDAFFHIQPKSVMYKRRPCYDIRFEVRSLKSFRRMTAGTILSTAACVRSSHARVGADRASPPLGQKTTSRWRR